MAPPRGPAHQRLRVIFREAGLFHRWPGSGKPFSVAWPQEVLAEPRKEVSEEVDHPETRQLERLGELCSRNRRQRALRIAWGNRFRSNHEFSVCVDALCRRYPANVRAPSRCRWYWRYVCVWLDDNNWRCSTGRWTELLVAGNGCETSIGTVHSISIGLL